jgi:hypothetical protein
LIFNGKDDFFVLVLKIVKKKKRVLSVVIVVCWKLTITVFGLLVVDSRVPGCDS